MDAEKVRYLREKLRLLERETDRPFGPDERGCCGLTFAQCHTLLEIGNAGEVSLVDLAAAFELDTSTLSRTVQGLVLIGLVNREAGKTDRRYVSLSLTEQGRKVFDEIETRFNDFFGRVLDLVPAADREKVLEGIGTLADAVRKANG